MSIRVPIFRSLVEVLVSKLEMVVWDIFDFWLRVCWFQPKSSLAARHWDGIIIVFCWSVFVVLWCCCFDFAYDVVCFVVEFINAKNKSTCSFVCVCVCVCA